MHTEYFPYHNILITLFMVSIVSLIKKIADTVFISTVRVQLVLFFAFLQEGSVSSMVSIESFCLI